MSKQISTDPGFIQPPKERHSERVPEILKEAHNRRLKAHERNYQQFLYNRDDPQKVYQKQEYLHFLIETNPQSCITYKNLAMTRLLLPTNTLLPMYENAKGELDGSVTDVLCARIAVSVENNESRLRGITGDIQFQCSVTLGKYLAPIVQLEYDSVKEVKDSHFRGTRNIFFYQFNDKNIQRIIKQFGQPKHLAVAEAVYSGELKNALRIINFDEWAQTKDARLLMGANTKGLISEHPTGVAAYQEYLKLEEKMIQSGVQKSRFDEITRDQIMELVARNEKAKSSKK